VLSAGFPIFRGLGDTTLEKVEAAATAAWQQHREFQQQDEAYGAQLAAAGGSGVAAAGGGKGGAPPPPQAAAPFNLATALLGSNWGGVLELPASPAAAAQLLELARKLPGQVQSMSRVEAYGAISAKAAKDIPEADQSIRSEISDLEAFWAVISDLPTPPLSAEEAEVIERVGLKKQQAAVVGRLRGLVALARAVGNSMSPAEVVEVRGVSFHSHCFLSFGGRV
jgi:hypothetical protein